ncbi:SesA protein [Nannizzia gypsea CBS 118893]|uniref:SesA protein n=1 Tax=Arthroderma gypseum (strain ATCC MYA-4604 / CBS 118893) TaxID=535722 RepID=E4UQA0_ARTGP|nr:SesA protein [Nannizzia gypsea CBS 118893]EFQ99181.1 SesA protein [Nannizzia gypsea CBS 118893]
MSADDLSSLISTTIEVLESAAAFYKRAENDTTLRKAFHAAGQGLPLITDALQATNDALNGRDLSSAAKRALGACSANANIAEDLFRDVARAPAASKYERYTTAVKRQGHKVESVVVGMMKDVCQMAKDNAIQEAMQPHVKKLDEAVENLSKMEPSVPEEQRSGYSFTNSGSGDQFNALGGSQHNNTSSGNQFLGSIGSVHGMRAPEEKQ